MNNIVLYSLKTCPKCKVLKKKLDSLNIKYTDITDDVTVLKFLKENELPSEVPVLAIDGFEPMNFNSAWAWASRQEEANG